MTDLSLGARPNAMESPPRPRRRIHSLSTVSPPGATGQPLMPEIGIIGLVPNQWDSPWMPRHHVLSRLGKYFNVVWMNPAHEWRDLLERAGEHRHPRRPAMPYPGFRVYTPQPWLPK